VRFLRTLLLKFTRARFLRTLLLKLLFLRTLLFKRCRPQKGSQIRTRAGMYKLHFACLLFSIEFLLWKCWFGALLVASQGEQPFQPCPRILSVPFCLNLQGFAYTAFARVFFVPFCLKLSFLLKGAISPYPFAYARFLRTLLLKCMFSVEGCDFSVPFCLNARFP
jgi:hypothetical protein